MARDLRRVSTIEGASFWHKDHVFADAINNNAVLLRIHDEELRNLFEAQRRDAETIKMLYEELKMLHGEVKALKKRIVNMEIERLAKN